MSEQEELATGGVIEPGGIPSVSDDPGPEIVFLPRNAQVYPCPGTAILTRGWFNGATYQQPQFVPTNTFPTEESLRAFVKKCVHEALDELAAEMNNKALQPTSRVE